VTWLGQNCSITLGTLMGNLKEFIYKDICHF